MRAVTASADCGSTFESTAAAFSRTWAAGSGSGVRISERLSKRRYRCFGGSSHKTERRQCRELHVAIAASDPIAQGRDGAVSLTVNTPQGLGRVTSDAHVLSGKELRQGRNACLGG